MPQTALKPLALPDRRVGCKRLLGSQLNETKVNALPRLHLALQHAQSTFYIGAVMDTLVAEIKQQFQLFQDAVVSPTFIYQAGAILLICLPG